MSDDGPGRVEPGAPLRLEARGISKSFPGVRALAGAELEVRAGEVHALLGENGAGKSTFMHILAGIHQPDAGTIRIEGREVRFADPREARDAGIAMVFQERSLAGPLSVADNVFVGRQPVRWNGLIDRAELTRRTARLLDDLGIHLHPDQVVEDLPPAAQQMVEIAKALSLEARLLVLDEPTSTLTDTEIAALFRVIERLTARGVGIVYITHRMGEVFRICDRMTVLRDGTFQGVFTRGDVTEDQLIARMVGRELGLLEATRRETRPARAAPALEVESLSDGRLLKDVTFAAWPGEITAFAGLTGSGRTELALAIFGDRVVTGGRIRVGGRAMSPSSPRMAIAAGIGYVPEDRKDVGLFLEMTVAANVAAARLDRFGSWWLDDRAMEAEAARLARRLALTAHIEGRPVRELSGGGQQKIVLARWLLVQPPVLIVDEPTRGIDIGAKREVHRLLRELADAGTAIVLISSELPELLAVADRILVMREGRLAGELSPSGATEEQVLRLASLHAA